MRKLLLFILLVTNIAVYSQRKVYQTSRFEGEAPKIDGHIDEAAWNMVKWDGNFTQWMPANGAPPSQNTEFKIIYDDNYLYVAVRAFDSVPEEIVKRMSRRDGFEGDFVEINIDSHHDLLTAYSFSATVAGVKGDERITQDGNNWDDTWDPIWFLKTSIDELGWIAEIKIPLTQLRFSSDSTQVWGLEVKRRIYRKDERSVWQPIVNTENGYVSKFGELHGLNNLKPKKQFEITPYVVGSYEHYKKEEGSPFSPGQDWKARGGVDAKIGLSNNITMDLTINPDFGQVEADPSEVNLSAFESYFEEKRPFFIEGRSIFKFPVEPGDGDDANNSLFYSRRIGRAPQYAPDYDYVKMPENTKILGAAKISGKTKKGLSIGVIESVTNEEVAQVKNINGTEGKIVVEPMTNYFTGRLEQEMNDGNTILGGMMTSTNRFIKNDHLNDLPTSALTGGINFDHSWDDKKFNISGKIIGSRVSGDSASMMNLQTSSRRYYQRPDSKVVRLDSNMKTLSGHSGYLTFGKFANSGWSAMGWISWISPGLELNDIGYLRSADNIMQIFWTGYRSPQPKGIYRNFNFNFSQWNGWNFDRTHLFWGLNSNAFMKFKNYWYANIGSNYESMGKSTTLLRGGPIFYKPQGINYWTNIGTDSRKKIAFELSLSQYFAFSKSAKVSYAGLGIIYRPTDRLTLVVEPSYFENKNAIQYLETAEFENKDEYFLAQIDQKTFMMEFRVDFSFTPDLSLQYYGQPFVSSGTYSNFKQVTNSTAKSFNDRFRMIYPDEEFGIDLNNNGNADVYISDPNFKYIYFQSNMVLRWEYLPGSTLFVVWSQSRDEGDYNVDELPFQIDGDMNRMFRIFPHDIFLVKLSYRIPL